MVYSHYQTVLYFKGEEFTVSLEERINRTAIPTSAEEKKKNFWAPNFRYEFSPTGQLTLKLGGVISNGARSNFSDGRTKLLENKLDHFIQHLLLAVGENKRERQRKEWEEAETIREFIKAKARRALKHPEQVESFAKFNKWVKWGLKYADSVDPLYSE